MSVTFLTKSLYAFVSVDWMLIKRYTRTHNSVFPLQLSSQVNSAHSFRNWQSKVFSQIYLSRTKPPKLSLCGGCKARWGYTRYLQLLLTAQCVLTATGGASSSKYWEYFPAMMSHSSLNIKIFFPQLKWCSAELSAQAVAFPCICVSKVNAKHLWLKFSPWVSCDQEVI